MLRWRFITARLNLVASLHYRGTDFFFQQERVFAVMVVVILSLYLNVTRLGKTGGTRFRMRLFI